LRGIPKVRAARCSALEKAGVSMRRVFSNGPSKDYVINPFNRLIGGSARLHLAAPYFSVAEPIVDAARAGKPVQLLIGLNVATNPAAVAATLGLPNLSVRYLTHRFHAKIYIFDEAALIGSANLTDGGLKANREAVLCLDQADDLDAIEEVRSLFLELWESAPVLTPAVLSAFTAAWHANRPKGPDPDDAIEKAVGRAEPANIHVSSRTKSRERLFLDDLQRQVYEQYGPAFNEVGQLLANHGFRRPELADIGLANETNRFLNWVRLTYVRGDEALQTASVRSAEIRRTEILALGQEWATTDKNRVPADYVDWLHTIQRLFGTPDAIARASKDDLTAGLMSLHAFTEQLRFVKGGLANLPAAFWGANRQDVDKVSRSLNYLLHGPDDFVLRLHDVLYEPQMKLSYFGRFCSLELYGSVKPQECPPVNGRMAKALRYLVD
jgi:hypothetical protein